MRRVIYAKQCNKAKVYNCMNILEGLGNLVLILSLLHWCLVGRRVSRLLTGLVHVTGCQGEGTMTRSRRKWGRWWGRWAGWRRGRRGPPDTQGGHRTASTALCKDRDQQGCTNDRGSFCLIWNIQAAFGKPSNSTCLMRKKIGSDKLFMYIIISKQKNIWHRLPGLIGPGFKAK